MRDKDQAVFETYRSGLLWAARSALIQMVATDNHRKTRVGAAVLASNKHDYRVLVGANYMPLPNCKVRADIRPLSRDFAPIVAGGPKYCAESLAISRTMTRGYCRIIALAVVGQPQTDDFSGVRGPTLYPCWSECHPMFDALGLDPMMPIITAFYPEWSSDLEPKKVECHTLEELRTRHLGRSMVPYEADDHTIAASNAFYARIPPPRTSCPL